MPLPAVAPSFQPDASRRQYPHSRQLHDTPQPQSAAPLGIDILHQGTHDGDGLLRSPELLAEIQVNGYGDAMTLGGLTSEFCQLSGLVRDGGRDTTPVEPGSTFHDLVEVEI